MVNKKLVLVFYLFKNQLSASKLGWDVNSYCCSGWWSVLHNKWSSLMHMLALWATVGHAATEINKSSYSSLLTLIVVTSLDKSKRNAYYFPLLSSLFLNFQYKYYYLSLKINAVELPFQRPWHPFLHCKEYGVLNELVTLPMMAKHWNYCYTSVMMHVAKVFPAVTAQL